MKKTLFDLELEPQIVALPTESLLAEINIKTGHGQIIATFKCPIITHVEKHVDWLKLEVNLSYPKTEPQPKKSKWTLK